VKFVDWNSPVLLFIRGGFWAVLFPGFIAGYVPWRVFGVSVSSDGFGPRAVTGIVVATLGLLLLVTCIVEFGHRGKGTLSPVDPPRELVVTGLYRWVRNPMYVGVSLMLFGEILISPSWGLALYAAAFVTLANLFIRAYEEPYLHRTFGKSYELYRRHVRRWLPRLRPWTPRQGPGGSR
jgi:protein-S-isoprenylcysteine O-methyltransferase Ste14